MTANAVAIDIDAAAVTRPLEGVAPFAELPEAALKAIEDIAEVRTLAPGETLFALGQYDGGQFFIVRSGALKISYADPATGSMVIETVPARGVYGLAAAVHGELHASHGAVTIGCDAATEVVEINAEEFRAVVAQRPSLTRVLMQHFAKMLVEASGRSETTAEANPERSVYAALISYIERDAVSGAWRIARMPRHRELAERAGVEEMVAANAIAHIIQEGVARRDYPGLVVDDIGELHRLAS